MGLKDLNIKISYDSDKDDILNDFYIPVLSNSLEYKRSVGFFSSTSLAIAARGISQFIINGGQMKLICGAKLKNNDLKVIKKVQQDPEKVIEDYFIQEMEYLEEGFIKNHLKALGWMLAKKNLEIKVAILYDENGIPLEENRGILHQKIGILRDNEGNMLSFSGSNNETAAAWKSNIEEFKVFRSWEYHEKEYLNTDIEKFEAYWKGKSRRMKILDIPKALKLKLINIAPDNIENLDLSETFVKKPNIELRNYQKEAIDIWNKNGKKGIFEMATGTGKTFTALGCLNNEFNQNSHILAIITAPQQHLIQQWKASIIKFGIKYDSLIIADSSNKQWKDQVVDLYLDISLGHKNKAIIITTHRTFSSELFKEFINYKDKFKIFLIADEVHGLGAEYSQSGLIKEYDYRLGLSATPKRFYDEYGTEIIYNYFGGTIYEFNMEKAINSINPATDESYLTPFIYNPKFLSLNNKELDEYFELSKQIAVKYYSKKEKNNENFMNSLLFKRSNIIKNANEKYDKLEEILDELGSDLKWTIIYCSEHQIKKVMEILKKKRISAHLFTMSEGTKPDKKYGGLTEREFILKKFNEEYYQVLIAIKCLDEGVDIPPARIAIIMASSGNPREHIQRLGRIIRRYPGKKKAIIYDLFVLPNLKKVPSEFKGLEKKIFEKEFNRYEEIANLAINNAEALDSIYNAKYRML
jgi:superfamily II DNA or RNA helicase